VTSDQLTRPAGSVSLAAAGLDADTAERVTYHAGLPR
jgi:hypothetical protein